MKDKIKYFLIGFGLCLLASLYMNGARELEVYVRFFTLLFLSVGVSFIVGYLVGSLTMATAKVIIKRKEDERK